jgi:hypothetical protein
MLFAVNDFAGALIKFTSVYTNTKDPHALRSMCVCENKLHHYAKALPLLRRYVSEGGALLSEQERTDAGATIKAIEPLTSTVWVAVSEAGADVFVDEERVGQSPIEPFPVDIGVHRLRAHKAEFQDFVVDFTVTGGAKVTIEPKLLPVVHEGRLRVTVGPKDAITIDGTPVAVGSWTGALKSGGHTLNVTAPDMLAYQTELLIQDGQSRDIGVTLNPEPRKGLPAWLWIGGGVVLAGGLGTAGYFLFKPSPKYDGPVGNVVPGIVQASAPVRF